MQFAGLSSDFMLWHHLQYDRSSYPLHKGLLIMEAILSFALLGFLAINLVGAFLIIRDRQDEWQIRKDGCKNSSQKLTSQHRPDNLL